MGRELGVGERRLIRGVGEAIKPMGVERQGGHLSRWLLNFKGIYGKNFLDFIGSVCGMVITKHGSH